MIFKIYRNNEVPWINITSKNWQFFKHLLFRENGESLAIVSVPSTTESHSDDEKDETTTSTHETQAPELTNAATKDPESPDKEDAPKEETDKSPTPTPPPKATSPEEPEKPDEEASKKTEDEKEETQQDSVAAVVVVQDTSASVNVDAEQEKVCVNKKLEKKYKILNCLKITHH